MQSINLLALKFLILTAILLFAIPGMANDSEQQSGVQESSKPTSSESAGSQIIQAFTSQEGDKESEIIKIDDQRKRQVMFAMGVPLLIFIFITVGLGIAMGVFGKDV